MKATQLRESSGSSVRTQWAQSVSGSWFSRSMVRSRYGYGWTKWAPSSPAPPMGPITQESIDYGTPTYGSTEVGGHDRVRLPA